MLVARHEEGPIPLATLPWSRPAKKRQGKGLNMPTPTELECRWAWYAAMRDMLQAPWYGMRSEREALRRTCVWLRDEFKPPTNGFWSGGGNYNY
jgi:hypothetical protein